MSIHAKEKFDALAIPAIQLGSQGEIGVGCSLHRRSGSKRRSIRRLRLRRTLGKYPYFGTARRQGRGR
jgi:hypothetical protein